MGTQDDTKSNIAATIYKEVERVLGGGDQLFAMQFPATPLNYRTYAYDTSDRNSVLTRPYTVAEAEFRLSDQLFSVSPIVQAPTGERLSVIYNTLINNYIPRLEEMAPFIRDRAGMAAFLLEESDEKDEDGSPMSRIELSKKLYREYLVAKNAWDEKKNAKFDEYRQADDLDGYARWLSSEGFVEQERLNNLHNDAVVRGHLHEVLTTLGYLNASSTAEELEVAKQRLRNSVRMSLDESMLVYPVQFQPSNWFEGLKPNLHPEDLTMAKGVIADQLRAKQKDMRRLQARYRQIELASVDPEDIEKLEVKVAVARDELKEAESGLIGQYGDAVVTAARCYSQATKGGKVASKTLEFKQQLMGLGVIEDEEDPRIELIRDAVESMKKTSQAQDDMMKASESLTALRAAKANAEAHDLRFEKIQITSQIEDLRADIEYLTGLVAGVAVLTTKEADLDTMSKAELLKHAATVTNNGATPPVNSEMTKAEIKQAIEDFGGSVELPVLPTTRENTEADGMFMDVVIKSNELEQSSAKDSQSTSSTTSWKVNLWFGSASGSRSSSSASSSQEDRFMSKEFEMGFRVAKVTFDRGGWFNPQLFRMSHAFYRLADLRAGAGLSVQDVQDATDLDALTSYRNGSKSLKYQLPAYPTAMIIAKDITIKIKSSESESRSNKSAMESSSSAGGGLFCFSASSSSQSKSAAESSFHGQKGEYFYIKIPGPQILGYFLQFVPEDNAAPYQPMWQDGKESAAAEAFRMFDELNKPKALGTPQQPRVAEPIRKAELPTTDA